MIFAVLRLPSLVLVAGWMGRISQACTSGTGNATFKSCFSWCAGGGGDAASDLASVPAAGPVGLVFSSLAAPASSPLRYRAEALTTAPASEHQPEEPVSCERVQSQERSS